MNPLVFRRANVSNINYYLDVNPNHMQMTGY